MTYFSFLFYFVLIPILALLAVAWLDKRAQRSAPGFDTGKIWLAIGAHVALALVYTTPWDNYLVATRVWSYNPALVTGIVFSYVPIEEYTFFLAETILSGLWWWFSARRISLLPNSGEGAGVRIFHPNPLLVSLSACLLSAAWLFSTCQFFLGPASWNYLGIIFFWALPAILPQLLFGADILWHYRKLVFWAIFIPGLYLSLTDIIALKATIWSISPSQTLGINFFVILPLEEVIFFFVTNALIAFGLTLMLSDLGRQRFQEWRARGFRGLP
jgi:lycopene cyclase domain-containing protein